MKKKALGFMLAATMTVSVFAGCGGNQNEGNTNEKENVTNSNEDTQSVSAETNENGDEHLRYGAGIPLLIFMPWNRQKRFIRKTIQILNWIFRKIFIMILRQS